MMQVLLGWLDVKVNVLYTFAAILAFLVLATVAVVILSRIYRDRDYSEVGLRIRTWWIMIGTVFIALASNQIISLVFFAFVSFLALREFLSLIPTRRADRLVLGLAYLTIPVQYYWIHTAWYGVFIIFIPIYAFLFFPMAMAGIGETQGFLRAVGTLHWGLMTTVFSISHTAFLLVLPEEGSPAAGGVGLVIFLLLLTQFNDVAQFLWGKSLGRHKVVPRVSPNKTWEGFLGGVATTMLVSYLLAPYLTPLTVHESLWIGILMGVAGFTGDVTVSAIKRDIQVKDSGSLLPGHGGILDRIDSLTFTAPIFFHIIYYLHY